MRLEDLIQRAPGSKIHYPASQAGAEVNHISDDSRQISDYSIFVLSALGRPWAGTVLQNTRALLLLESSQLKLVGDAELPAERLLVCDDLKKAQGFLASALYGHPSHSLR